jgi:hypothetical protein
VRILLFSNTTVNFFANIFTHPDFRYAIIKIFCHKRYLEAKRSSMTKACSRMSDADSACLQASPASPSKLLTMSLTALSESTPGDDHITQV